MEVSVGFTHARTQKCGTLLEAETGKGTPGGRGLCEVGQSTGELVPFPAATDCCCCCGGGVLVSRACSTALLRKFMMTVLWAGYEVITKNCPVEP